MIETHKLQSDHQAAGDLQGVVGAQLLLPSAASELRLLVLAERGQSAQVCSGAAERRHSPGPGAQPNGELPDQPHNGML